MQKKAQVGAMSTQDHADPKADPKPAPKKPDVTPPPAKPAAAPDGNTPVDRQPTQDEHDRLRPADQP